MGHLLEVLLDRVVLFLSSMDPLVARGEGSSSSSDSEPLLSCTFGFLPLRLLSDPEALLSLDLCPTAGDRFLGGRPRPRLGSVFTDRSLSEPDALLSLNLLIAEGGVPKAALGFLGGRPLPLWGSEGFTGSILEDKLVVGFTCFGFGGVVTLGGDGGLMTGLDRA